MFTDDEKLVLNQLFDVEEKQRFVLNEINSILESIPNVYEEGEESRPDLKAKNNEMKSLIMERQALLSSINIEAKYPLPDDIAHSHFFDKIGQEEK